MTLVSTIILDAFRESNILALAKAPTADQSTEALRLYSRVITGIYTGDGGERLQDWPLGNFGRQPNSADWLPPADQLFYPPINRRLIASAVAPVETYLTPFPQDGARMGIADPFNRLAAFPVTLNANGRIIENDMAIVLNTNGTERQWIYRADLARWVRITDILEDGENPFPPEFDTMFIVLLAMRLNSRYGRMLDDQTIASLKENKQQFVARYIQSLPLEINDDLTWPFMSLQTYQSGAYGSNTAFNRGVE